MTLPLLTVLSHQHRVIFSSEMSEAGPAVMIVNKPQNTNADRFACNKIHKLRVFFFFVFFFNALLRTFT